MKVELNENNALLVTKHKLKTHWNESEFNYITYKIKTLG